MFQRIEIRPRHKKVTEATNKLAHSMVLVLRFLHRRDKVGHINHDSETGTIVAYVDASEVGFVMAEAQGHKMRVAC